MASMENLSGGQSAGSHLLLAVGDYGPRDVKRFEVDEMSGDVARVSYGVGMPKFDQKQEPWTREAGVWSYDDC